MGSNPGMMPLTGGNVLKSGLNHRESLAGMHGLGIRSRARAGIISGNMGNPVSEAIQTATIASNLGFKLPRQVSVPMHTAGLSAGLVGVSGGDQSTNPFTSLGTPQGDFSITNKAAFGSAAEGSPKTAYDPNFGIQGQYEYNAMGVNQNIFGPNSGAYQATSATTNGRIPSTPPIANGPMGINGVVTSMETM